MSWNDSKSPWTRKLKRRILYSKLLCAANFIPVIAIIALLWWLNAEIGEFPDKIFALFVVPIVLFETIFVAILLWHLRIEQTVLKEVPRRDGHLCPRCRTALPEEPAQGDCPKCHTPYTRAELQSYWVDYVFESQRLRPWAAKLSWRQRLISPRDPTKEKFLALSILIIILLIPALLLIWRVTGLSFMGVVVRYLPLLLGCNLIAPGIIYLRRYRNRTGQTRHCTACGYQQAPQGENPQRCPECGANWSRPGGVIIGTQARQPRNLWLACGFFGVSAVLIITHMASPFPGIGWSLRVLPTSSLIRDATSSGSFTQAEWNEIRRRQLTPEQQLQLAVGLLDKRLREEYLDSTEGGWLWTMVSTSALPNDLIERYYREMLEVWIDAPATTTVGTPFSVSLGSTFRYSDLPVGIDEVVYFGGFFVGDDLTPRARRKDSNHAVLLDDREHQIQINITPSSAGPLRIRAVLYFAIGPNLAWAKTSAQWAQWHDDETATLPPAAIWSRRIELEQTITVNE